MSIEDRNTSEQRFAAITDDILTRLGVSEVSRGGKLLRSAVLIAAKEPMRRTTLSALSEIIAEPLGKKPQEISNSMRCAYEIAYIKTGFAPLSALCQNPAKKPKFSEFMAMTTEMVRYIAETEVLVSGRE